MFRPCFWVKDFFSIQTGYLSIKDFFTVQIFDTHSETRWFLDPGFFFTPNFFSLPQNQLTQPVLFEYQGVFSSPMLFFSVLPPLFLQRPNDVFRHLSYTQICFSCIKTMPLPFFWHQNDVCQTPQETRVGDARNKNTKNKPKKCPNCSNMMGCFLWICMSETCQQFHATLTPGREWEIHMKHSWRNPPKNFYEVTTIWDTNVKNSWRNPQRNNNRSKKK